MRSSRFLPLVALLPLAMPLTARAQGTAPSAPRLGALVPSLSVRTRVESWDWFDPADPRSVNGTLWNSAYTFSGSIVRGGLAQQFARWGWRAELAVPVLLGLPDSAAAPAPLGQLGTGAAYFAANNAAGERSTSMASVFLKQAYVRLGAPPARGGHALRLGRFEVSDGAETAPANATLAAVKRDRIAQRLIGPFGWTHVGRAFDGAHYTFDRRGANATAFVVRPTQGAFELNGWDELDIVVGYGALTLPVRSRTMPGDVRLFASHYVDSRDRAGVVKTDNRALAVRTADRKDVAVTSLGAHWLQLAPTALGDVDLLLWGVAQTGKWGALDHRASATDVELGWQPQGMPQLRPWVRVGWLRGSGDANAADAKHGTFFQMLPTLRIYSRTPFYNQQNSDELSASLILRPGARLTLRGDARRLQLAQAADLWYAGGGAFEHTSFGMAGRPSNGSTDLATLLDLSADFRLTPRWTVGAYGSLMRGGTVVERIYPAGGNGTFALLELQYAR
jgi:hypothetical protein